MGSYGTNATSNDCAQDWLDRHVCTPIRVALAEGEPEEALVALWLMNALDMTPIFPKRLISSAFDRIEEYDSKSNWKDPISRDKDIEFLRKCISDSHGPHLKVSVRPRHGRVLIIDERDSSVGDLSRESAIDLAIDLLEAAHAAGDISESFPHDAIDQIRDYQSDFKE